MSKPAVIIVGADKGGVGKTTVCRTLLDYMAHRKVPARAFDSEAPRGTLSRFHPSVTSVVDLSRVPDQMKIFDTLADSTVTLIDVRAGLLSPTLHALSDIGFLEAARKGQITFTVMHLLGPTIASLNEIASTSELMVGSKYFLVKNHINDTQFFEWDQATYANYFKSAPLPEIAIPRLNEMACEQVELASVPYISFIANKKATDEPVNYSFVLRGYVRHWLQNVWAEYDRVKLSEQMAPSV